MQDRVSLYPGRVKLEPVAGQANTYDLTRADQPTQEGTPLNKASLLKDYTCGLLGLSSAAVPDDALLALLIGVGYYGYRVKVQLADGSPVEGATVSGISALPGSSLVTGADGIAVGRSSSASVTINCTSPYIDQKAPAAQVVTKTGTITDVTLTLTNIVDAIKITKSGKFSFSQNAISVDLYGIGGGGGGAGAGDADSIAYNGKGGNGGGGGHAINVLQHPLSAKRNLSVVIGSGGSGGLGGGKPGGNGGTTQVQIDSATILTAAGGTGATKAAIGTGGADGGLGLDDGANPGSDDNTYLFNDTSLGIVAGGGGGGGCGYNTSSTYRVRGGSPNGGAGGVCGLSVSYEGSDVNGEDGKMGGGGGGGGTHGTGVDAGGAGGAGGVYLRFHF